MKRRDERLGAHNVNDDPEALSRLRDRLTLIEDETKVAAQDRVHLPIDSIVPDPIQPRRAMPAVLRANWIAGTPLEDIFYSWQSEAAIDLESRGLPADAQYWLNPATSDTELPGHRWASFDTLQPHTRLWIELLQLASSIREAGLEQPITVYPVSETLYRVQTGERRLLAHHALRWHGYKGFDSIATIIRETYDPLRQAAENGARKDLNAVALARQIALLLKAFTPGEWQDPGRQPDHAWYAAASDLNVPYGQAQQFATLVGLPNPRMVHRYKSLLSLPVPFLAIADEMNWTEGRIRSLVSRAGGNEEHLITLGRQEQLKQLGLANRPSQSVRERAAARVQGSVKALGRVATMSDEELNALPETDRQRLIQAVREVLTRLSH